MRERDEGEGKERRVRRGMKERDEEKCMGGGGWARMVRTVGMEGEGGEGVCVMVCVMVTVRRRRVSPVLVAR